MRAIRLPEPPSGPVKMPEIFDRGITSVIRRAIIIGNGSAGAEHQSIGLVRALGLGNKYTLHVSLVYLRVSEFSLLHRIWTTEKEKIGFECAFFSLLQFHSFLRGTSE